MSPFDFVVSDPDDLLVWADVWEDAGFPKHGQACRVVHGHGWFPSGNSAWGRSFAVWDTFEDKLLPPGKSDVLAAAVGLPVNGPVYRHYGSAALAFLDLINHMVLTGKVT